MHTFIHPTAQRRNVGLKQIASAGCFDTSTCAVFVEQLSKFYKSTRCFFLILVRFHDMTHLWWNLTIIWVCSVALNRSPLSVIHCFVTITSKGHLNLKCCSIQRNDFLENPSCNLSTSTVWDLFISVGVYLLLRLRDIRILGLFAYPLQHIQHRK